MNWFSFKLNFFSREPNRFWSTLNLFSSRPNKFKCRPNLFGLKQNKFIFEPSAFRSALKKFRSELNWFKSELNRSQGGPGLHRLTRARSCKHHVPASSRQGKTGGRLSDQTMSGLAAPIRPIESCPPPWPYPVKCDFA